MKNYFLKTAWEIIKSRLFEAVLARLSEARIQQRQAAPAFFEKLEAYVEPYARAFPKAVTFVVWKLALAIVMLSSFFTLFSEALRQIDTLGGLVPGAYLVGYTVLFLASSAAFWLIKPPRVERVVAAERAIMQAEPMQAEGPEGLRDFDNVEQLRRPTPLSASEVLLNELRAERARFFSIVHG